MGNGQCKRLAFIKEFDVFGKEPKLYFKGKERKTTWYGSFFTLFYLTIYFAYFFYKVLRMFKKTDVKFYDSFEYLDGPPSIHLTKEKFTGGFALEHPETYDQFIDETIYYPKAYFKIQTRKDDDDNWDIQTIDLELERCSPDSFGEDFQDSLIDSIENLYCFKDLDVTLEGSFSYDTYAYFAVDFFPCKNSSENNNHCKTKEELDYYLMNTFVCFELEDAQLTPTNYSKPVHGRNNDIYYTVGKKLFQEVHIFYQLVDIETDLDIIGFDEFPNFKQDLYIKYDWDYQMSSLLEEDIYETGNPFCSAQIKLDDEIRIETRTYMKLITLFSDVGGLMEFMLSIFKVVTSFTIDLQYDTSIVNNLFEFDLNKKVVSIKKRLNKKNVIENLDNNEITLKKIPTKAEHISAKSRVHIYEYEKNTVQSKSKLNEANNLLNNLTKITINDNQPLKKKKKKKKKKNAPENNILEDKKFNESKDNNHNEITKKEKEPDEEKSYIIQEIVHNRCFIYFCFFWARKKKNLQNTLINEGINLYRKKMDIIRFFRKLYKSDEKTEETTTITMSEPCKKSILEILKKNNNKLPS